MLNTRFLFLSIILLSGFTLTSCDDDAEDMGPDDEKVVILNVNDQVLS